MLGFTIEPAHNITQKKARDERPRLLCYHRQWISTCFVINSPIFRRDLLRFDLWVAHSQQTKANRRLCAELCGAKKHSFRTLLSGFLRSKDEEPPRASNRSTKRSNLMREQRLTNRRVLIRPDFRAAGIQFPTTQRIACSAREFFIPHSKPLEVCFFKTFKIE